MQKELLECVKACRETADTCQTTLFNHCLHKGGRHVEHEHITLMQDCIEMCRVTAHFMLRQSLYHEYTCTVCGDICEACAISCEEIGDPEMEACAKQCRECATLCRKMARKGAPPLRRVR